MPGPTEIIIILFILILLFGAKKLPELAQGMGSAMREFKKASREALNDDDDEPVRTTTTTTDAPRRMEVADKPAETTTSATG